MYLRGSDYSGSGNSMADAGTDVDITFVPCDGCMEKIY